MPKAHDAVDMVEGQIARRGIRDLRVLEAMQTVPRDRFVPESLQQQAYFDEALPIGYGQTISQPYVVALMTEALGPQAGDTVLEIGTGSGYQAAVLSRLVGHVYSVETVLELANAAHQRLADLGYTNVDIMVADGSLGWPEHAPYDGIIVTAAAPDIPAPLLDQLRDGGRLVIPVGRRYEQMLVLVTRQGDHFDQVYLTAVAFVPLIGRHGWDAQAWSGTDLDYY